MRTFLVPSFLLFFLILRSVLHLGISFYAPSRCVITECSFLCFSVCFSVSLYVFIMWCRENMSFVVLLFYFIFLFYFLRIQTIYFSAWIFSLLFHFSFFQLNMVMIFSALDISLLSLYWYPNLNSPSVLPVLILAQKSSSINPRVFLFFTLGSPNLGQAFIWKKFLSIPVVKTATPLLFQLSFVLSLSWYCICYV